MKSENKNKSMISSSGVNNSLFSPKNSINSNHMNSLKNTSNEVNKSLDNVVHPISPKNKL